jgi:hypothetical protein
VCSCFTPPKNSPWAGQSSIEEGPPIQLPISAQKKNVIARLVRAIHFVFHPDLALPLGRVMTKSSLLVISTPTRDPIDAPRQDLHLVFMMTDENDIPVDIGELARAHGKRAIEVIAEIMNSPDAPASVRLSAAKTLLDRGWGKASSRLPKRESRAAPVMRVERAIVDQRRSEPEQASKRLEATGTVYAGAKKCCNCTGLGGRKPHARTPAFTRRIRAGYGFTACRHLHCGAVGARAGPRGNL